MIPFSGAVPGNSSRGHRPSYGASISTECGPRVPEYRVVPLDGGHCVINDGADLRLGRIAFEVGPACLLWPQKIDTALYSSLWHNALKVAATPFVLGSQASDTHCAIAIIPLRSTHLLSRKTAQWIRSSEGLIAMRTLARIHRQKK